MELLGWVLWGVTAGKRGPSLGTPHSWSGCPRFLGFPDTLMSLSPQFSVLLGLHHIQGDLLGSASLWGLPITSGSPYLWDLPHPGVSNILGSPSPWVLHPLGFPTSPCSIVPLPQVLHHLGVSMALGVSAPAGQGLCTPSGRM